jgi:hypothetical protein
MILLMEFPKILNDFFEGSISYHLKVIAWLLLPEIPTNFQMELIIIYRHI